MAKGKKIKPGNNNAYQNEFATDANVGSSSSERQAAQKPSNSNNR